MAKGSHQDPAQALVSEKQVGVSPHKAKEKQV